MNSALPEENKAAESKARATSAKAVQRKDSAKGGQYQCQKCQNSFNHSAGPLQCPRCLTQNADILVLTYTEETPGNEMLSKEEFAAGD